MRHLKRVIVVVAVWLSLAPIGLAQESTPSEDAALQAYRQGSFGKAVQLYTRALSETTDPQHRARLHVRIGWTLFALGREDEVDTHLKAALLEDPELTLVPDYYTSDFLDRFEAARRVAFASPGSSEIPAADLEATITTIQQRVTEENDLEGALADTDRLLAAFPQDGRLIPLKVQVLEALGQDAEALELRQTYGLGDDLSAAIGAASYLDMLSIPDLILRANRLLDEGDLDNSLDLLREVVARQPSNVAGLELMAEAARRAARWQEAEFALKSALGLQPDNIGLKLRLGEVYLAMSDASAARDVFRQLTEAYPHSDRAWAALGLLDARLGNTERALNELSTALHENPLLPEVQLAYGELQLADGNATEALEAFRSAANLLQDDPQVEARLGQALLAQGDPETALSHLRTAHQSGFDPPDVLRSLSLAQIENDLMSEARRTIDSIDADAVEDDLLLQGILHLQRGRNAEAEAQLLRLGESRPSDPGILNLLAVAVYRQARYAEAQAYLSRASELTESDQTIEGNLAHARAATTAEFMAAQALVTRRASTK